VTALVTSRERLSLHHEWVYAIGGMVVPESDTPEDVFDYDAAKLFLRCAQQVRPDFDGQGQPIVAHLCRLVGGMPLAILLAAAWVDTLPLEEIVSEIAGSLDVLTAERRDVPERHHSIRAVFEPTWRQLTAEEQNVFMRFSVFRGGCRREAAEQVAGATLPILQALVDKALLTCGADGRYEIHDLLRQYAAEKLEAKRGTADSRNAHSAHYLAFMKAREEDIKGRKQFEAAGEIEADFQNVRSAWLWAVEGKDYKGIDHSLETLYRFCELGTRLQEGEELFRLAQEGLAPPPGQEPHPVWGRIPVRRCWCTHSPEYERDKELVATSLAFARKQGDQREVAFCLTMLSSINLQTGREPAQTRAYLDESLKICQELDDRFQMAQTLRALGFWSSTMAGRLDDAYVYYQQAVDLHREMGNRVTEGTTLRDLGIITSIRGKQEEAEDYTREALTIAGELNALLDIAWGSGNLSSIIFDRGDFEQAAALAEEARSVALDINQPGIQACASCTLGWVAAMEGDYERSRELLEEGTALSQHPETVAYLNWGLSLAACGLEAYAAARHHLHCALRFWGANRHTTPSLNALTVAGILLAHEGEVERAVEMLGLAFTHPASATGWMEKWPLLTRLRVDLEAELGAEVYQSAWERGAERDLDEVVAELLAAYKTDPAS
jgi:tetratricopeptide (TPR) repeat protein